MANNSYFWFDGENKIKYTYSHNQKKDMGKLKSYDCTGPNEATLKMTKHETQNTKINTKYKLPKNCH